MHVDAVNNTGKKPEVGYNTWVFINFKFQSEFPVSDDEPDLQIDEDTNKEVADFFVGSSNKFDVSLLAIKYLQHKKHVIRSNKSGPITLDYIVVIFGKDEETEKQEDEKKKNHCC